MKLIKGKRQYKLPPSVRIAHVINNWCIEHAVDADRHDKQEVVRSLVALIEPALASPKHEGLTREAVDAEFTDKRVDEIASAVMKANIDPSGASAFSLLNDDQAALLNLQIGLAVSQVVDSFRARLTSAKTSGEWQPIETAPKDGTKIDLLYPYPRGRVINAEWADRLKIGWFWRTPTWEKGELLPESDWLTNTLPNMKPTHWMPLPAPPNEAQ